MEKMKAVAESALTGLVTAVFSYQLLITPATLAAFETRRKYPEAWFSSMIGWYATFVVIGISLILAAVATRLVYRHVTEAARTDKEIDTKYRTAFIVTMTIVVCMFVLEWAVMAAMQRAVTTGWELPLWFRILFAVGMLWRSFWPYLSILLLVALVAIASLTSVLRRSRTQT